MTKEGANKDLKLVLAIEMMPISQGCKIEVTFGGKNITLTFSQISDRLGCDGALSSNSKILNATFFFRQ